MSGAESEAEPVETPSETAEELERDSESPEMDGEEVASSLEPERRLEAAAGAPDVSGGVIYVGHGPVSSYAMEDRDMVLEPWEEGSDLLEPETEGLDSALYFIDGALAGTLARQDWVTERNPSADIRRDGYGNSLDLATGLARDWAESLVGMDELTGVVVRGEVHPGREEPPVKFDYENRRNGGQESVAYRVFGEFMDTLAENDWTVEYVERTEDGLEAYMAP